MTTPSTLKEALGRRCISSVVINENALQSGEVYRTYPMRLMKTTAVWHAFILFDVPNPDRNIVLKILLDYLYPAELVPVNYRVFGNDCMFVARDCESAISKLCEGYLIIPIPNKSNGIIKCEIILKYILPGELKVNAEVNVAAVLKKLWNPITKILNLDNFVANPDLQEYCALSQPKLLFFVLHIAATMQPYGIILSNNEIINLGPIEALSSCHCLQYLDLRHNNIDNVSIEALHRLRLEHLWLDGNPICEGQDELSYVHMVRKHLSSLQNLDGVELPQNGLAASKKNFLCNLEGFNLIDQFIDQFYTCFDFDRKSLEGLYHPDAMFSITQVYNPGQKSSKDAKLLPYQVNCRNLLAVADIAKTQQFLYFGNICIVKKLEQLPLTKHDPFSFKVDLIYYSETCAILTISGVFREPSDVFLKPDRFLGFSRTFVLTGCKGEYAIKNDMWHLYNAITYQQKMAFKISKPFIQKPLIPETDLEKKKVIQAFALTTGVRETWSRRFLAENDYDIIVCLKKFVKDFKVDKIPEEAFIK